MPFFLLLLAVASSWYYPLSDFANRQSYKTFGQYVDNQFYQDKSGLFPTHYLGFHAGLDLEVFPKEADLPVPVYAISSGRIIYSGFVTGYGGLILQKLDGVTNLALYGHLQLSSLPKVGEFVTAGSRLAFLGSAFSKDTGGERKHLHFAITRGASQYFKGYEPSLSALNSHWLDPSVFLSAHITGPISTPSFFNLLRDLLLSLLR
jgi:murein DD-endopeptidase MepM/ murein hydrolase activator NlpD